MYFEGRLALPFRFLLGCIYVGAGFDLWLIANFDFEGFFIWVWCFQLLCLVLYWLADVCVCGLWLRGVLGL